MTARPAVGWRLPALAAAGLCLAGGLYAALLLLGTPVPAPRPPWRRCTGR
ncbi:hypothetical protein ACFQY4_14610 [Catellatospora bangladeshensis]